MPHTKKVLVMVTGASRGLGKAMCEKLSKEEGVIVVRGVRDIKDSPGHSILLDVSDESTVVKAAQDVEAIAKAEAVHELVLVNNAGIGEDLPWKPANKQIAEKTLCVNVTGVHLVTKHFLPLLLAFGKGRIINISSGAALMNLEKTQPHMREQLSTAMDYPSIEKHVAAFVSYYEAASSLPCDSPAGYWLQAYGFSKALLNSYTRHIASSHPTLVVHACTPGFVATDMTQGADPSKMKTPEEGAVTPCFLILGSADGSEASYWKDGCVKGEWC